MIFLLFFLVFSCPVWAQYPATPVPTTPLPTTATINKTFEDYMQCSSLTLTYSNSLDLSLARHRIIAVASSSAAYFAGGDSSIFHFSNHVDIYNADSQDWLTASLSVGRVDLAGSYIDGKYLFAGGKTSSFSTTRVVDVFDHVNGGLRTTFPQGLSVSRSNLQAVSVLYYDCSIQIFYFRLEISYCLLEENTITI